MNCEFQLVKGAYSGDKQINNGSCCSNASFRKN